MSRPNEDERGHIFNTGIITKLRDICNQYNIYLYGAGMYGKTLCAYIQEQKIGYIDKFIVSERDAGQVVLGKNVITLEEYSAQRTTISEFVEEDIIIIAVSERYSTEVVNRLENRNLHNYITLTQKEWDVIGREVLFDWVIPQKNIAVLMYHRIIDSDYTFWQLNVSPKTFEKHIKYISENYKVLRLEEEWSDIVVPDEKYVVITFDDGYVDNYRFALPILEKYQVPATIFVSTDLIDTDDMYWWDELEKIFIVDKYVGEFVFAGIQYKIADLNDRRKVCLTIRNRIKVMSSAERRNSMSELRSVMKVEQSFTSELRCVNTSELIRMAESPYVTIGGHTKSHLSMGKVHSAELLHSEMEESLEILEKKIGKKIEVFAYPFGGAEDWCDASDQIMVECGIKKSVLVKNGNVSIDDKMYNIPRHMIFDSEDIVKKMRKIWGIYG